MLDAKYHHLPTHNGPAAPVRRLSFGFTTGGPRALMNIILAVNALLWMLVLCYLFSNHVLQTSDIAVPPAFAVADVPVRLSGSWFPNRPPVSCSVMQAGEHLPTGKHYLVDLHGVDRNALDMLETEAAFDTIAGYIHAAGMTLLGTSAHRFECGGMTAVFLLSESHVSIHTWPEHRFVALDVYTCGSGNPKNIVESFEAFLRPTRAVKTLVDRGADHHINLNNQVQPASKPPATLQTRPAPTGQSENSRALPLPSNRKPADPSAQKQLTLGDLRDATTPRGRDKDGNLLADICINGDTVEDDCYLLRQATILADERSEYQRIEIVDTQSFGRCMLLDRVVQFCESDNELYTTQIIEKVFEPHNKGAVARTKTKHEPTGLSVQLVGGGDGWVTSAILDRYSHLVGKIVAVDIDPAVTTLTQEHFEPAGVNDGFTDSRVTWIYADAGKWLDQSGPSSSVDIFIIDCTDHTAEAAKILYTQEFYNNVYRMLKPGGRVVQQMNTEETEYSQFFRDAERVWLGSGLKNLQKWSEYIPSFGGKSVFWMAEKYQV